MKIVLVPSTGFSYLNSVPCSHPPFQFSSRPLHGVLLSQYCPLHLLKHRAFIPHLRGKPANERNLNIKRCITSTKPDFKPIGAKLSYFLKFNPPHPHMIQLSLILCTLTDMRCQFKLQVFGMFMHNIIFSKCIFKHIIHNFYCITAKQWI